MADKPETEEQVVENQTDEQAAQSLTDGFEAPTQPGEAATGEPNGEADQGQGGEEEVEYVQVSRKDFDRLMAAAEKAETIDGVVNKLNGTIGNVKNDLLHRLQEMTPAGEPVEVTIEDFEEMNADFEELTKQQVAGLNRVLKKINLRGTGKPAPAEIDPAKFDEAVHARIEKIAIEELNDLHPGWQEIVGAPDSDTPFRKWLGEQPEDYRNLITNTQSASVTKRAIDKFQAAEKATKAPPATPPARKPPVDRRERIAGSVQPRGTGGTPPGPSRNTPEQDLQAGFASG